MATAPLYAPLPFFAFAQLSVANAFLNGGGTIVDLKAASTTGAAFTRFDRIRIQATGDTTAGAVRFFTKRGGLGTWMFVKQFSVPARLASSADGPWGLDIDCTMISDLIYLLGGSTDKLGVATLKAETFNVFAWGGDTN